jgi:hypothetical protein
MIYTELTKKSLRIAYNAHQGQVDRTGLRSVPSSYADGRVVTSHAVIVIYQKYLKCS